MSKVKFICENDDGTKIQHELDSDYLYDIVDQFEYFLKGCGFVFNRLDINNRDDFNQDELKLDFDLSESQWNNDYYNSYYSMADDTADNDVMAWTSDEIMKASSVKKDANLCSVCKIDTGVMNDWTCYDTNCPKISRR